MDTISLPHYPSCYSCASWSADGELAVAAGEYVYVLTPRGIEEDSGDESEPTPGTANQWHIARIRVNTFTNKELHVFYPRGRDHFSIGREQSISHATGLAWSPPGLVKHRRCLLAVLTSNMALSFYECVAQGKWERVAIVNTFLERHFSTFISSDDAFQKTGIRSFSWCSPLKTPTAGDSASPYHVPRPESRWGFYFLNITNDDNDVICLQVRRSSTETDAASQFSMNILSLTSLHDLVGNYPTVQPASLLSMAVKSGLKATSLSCGPWVPNAEVEKGAYVATALVAVVYGTKLKVVRLDVSVPMQDVATGYQRSTTANLAEFAMSAENLGNYHFRGPIQWISNDVSQCVYLAAGIFSGLLVTTIPYDVYAGKAEAKAALETRELPFYTTSEMQGPERHWEPITGMTTVVDGQTRTTTLHLGTAGGYKLAKVFPDPSDDSSVASAPWKERLDNLRDGFDIDHDLGGLAIDRIWGLVSHRGLVASVATLHPGDMIEYGAPATDATSIAISPARHDGDVLSLLHGGASNRSPRSMRAERERVINFILHVGQGNKDMWSNRLTYAAACCVIVESENEPLRLHAREALENLATAVGVDLSEEISKCSAGPGSMEPKLVEQLNGPGGQLFEKCDVCDAGVAWYSARESQCAAGHLFARCNLSFLSIQEPGITKTCSNCGTEYLNEEQIQPAQGIYELISNAFDTCIYCDGKFRD